MMKEELLLKIMNKFLVNDNDNDNDNNINDEGGIVAQDNEQIPDDNA